MRAGRFAMARLAGLALILGISGCGFRPLYAPSGSSNATLSGVFVDVIVNRNGQLLRQALQERLDGSGASDRRYELSVYYAENSQGIAIQGDSSATRTRTIGTATWVLHKPGPWGDKVTSGVARSLDGMNVIDSQFFYGDLQSKAIDERMGQALADQIVQSIALYFRTHQQDAAG